MFESVNCWTDHDIRCKDWRDDANEILLKTIFSPDENNRFLASKKPQSIAKV